MSAIETRCSFAAEGMSASILQTAETMVHCEYGPVHTPRTLRSEEHNAVSHFLRCQQLLVGNMSDERVQDLQVVLWFLVK